MSNETQSDQPQSDPTPEATPTASTVLAAVRRPEALPSDVVVGSRVAGDVYEAEWVPTLPSDEVTSPVIARAGAYYRNARYIMFTIIVSMGFWFLYDGFVKYPAENVAFDDLSAKILELDRTPQTRDEAQYLRYVTQRKSMKKHEPFSLNVQKALGFSLPPIAIALIIYWMYKSRGEIRLENRVLSAPGQPPVPLASIDELDKGLWDKKGIALVFYTLPNNVTGKLRLDDFIYQARPIREIVKQIENELKSQDQIIAKIKATPESVAPAKS